jgi:hypothetical protein
VENPLAFCRNILLVIRTTVSKTLIYSIFCTICRCT